MASEKLETVWDIINKYDPICIVHGHSDKREILKQNFPNPDPDKLTFGKELYNICKKSQGKTLYFPKLKPITVIQLSRHLYGDLLNLIKV